MIETSRHQPLLTIAEAADYLNVSAGWVADAARRRKLRCTRIGKHIRFRTEHLDELIAAGEQPVTVNAAGERAVSQLRRGRARSRL